jgi:uncharacterized protein (UPF0333 family)
MIHITDEILNRYLDGELSGEEVKQIKSTLLSSKELLMKFNALKLVHENLSGLKEYEVNPGFTEKLMKQIVKRRFVVPKQQKYFIVSVAAFITLLCLVIFGFAISAVISASPSSAEESKTFVDSVSNLSNGIVKIVSQIFKGQGLSIIGSIFSIIILISGYFFFEMQKRVKTNLGNGQHL